MERPQTRYVEVGGAEVAYQVVGQGPPDVVYVPGFNHVDVRWEAPVWAAFLQRLASFGRLILFDRRGTRDLLDLATHCPYSGSVARLG